MAPGIVARTCMKLYSLVLEALIWLRNEYVTSPPELVSLVQYSEGCRFSNGSTLAENSVATLSGKFIPNPMLYRFPKELPVHFAPNESVLREEQVTSYAGVTGSCQLLWSRYSLPPL